jgi:pyrroloquinoline quinone biosynthesis protein E
VQGIPWSRPEAFGAWVRLDDATLVAVDERLAARLGVAHGGPDGTQVAIAPRPLELHVAVTSRCPAPCTGCYLDARPDGHEPTFDELARRLEEARAAGVSTVAFGGGEPLTRGDLGRLAALARGLGLVPVMTTSGFGLTEERAQELEAFAQVNVSHDGVDGAYEAVRGFDAAAHAERAIAMLAAAGVPVGANVVLTASSFESLARTAARVAELGATEIQLLRYKPAGRADDPGYASRRLTPAQVRALWPTIAALVQAVAHARRLRVRIDCAMVPLLSESLLDAVPDAPRALASLGVFGCEAARHLGALRATGEPAACSFFSLARSAPLPLRREPVSARPSAAAPALDLGRTWDEDGGLVALRAYHASPPEPCRSCALFSVCRGGCQVVSRHAFGAFAPDPECPRVARWGAR